MAGPSADGFTKEGTGNPGQRRRGRPPGSVGVTDDLEAQMVAYLLGGASVATAAEAAGQPRRTVYEWIQRGEGRHARPPTPRLRKFARALRMAHAQVALSAQNHLLKENPAKWLAQVHRWPGEDDRGRDGGPDGDAPGFIRLEDRLAELDRLQAEGGPPGGGGGAGPVITLEQRVREREERKERDRRAAAASDGCADPSCPCPRHEEVGP